MTEKVPDQTVVAPTRVKAEPSPQPLNPPRTKTPWVAGSKFVAAICTPMSTEKVTSTAMFCPVAAPASASIPITIPHSIFVFISAP